MKLNYDCVRDVLLTIEEITGLDDELSFETIGFYDIVSHLSQYDDKEIYYTILKLSEADYIKTEWLDDKQKNFNFYFVFDITFKGHEYLNSIRNQTVWNAIKKSAIGLSMTLIPKLAEAYVLNHANFLK